MENTMKNPRMETILTAADIYGLSPHCVRRWAAEGNVISVRAGRKILVNTDSLRRFLETGQPQGTPPKAAPHTENAPRIAPISLK